MLKIFVLALLDAVLEFIYVCIRYWYLVLGFLTVIGIIYGITYVVTYREYKDAQVSYIGWATRYDVYTYATVHDSGWSIPSGGRETNRYQKQRSTRTVVTGYKTKTIKGTCTTDRKGKRSCTSDKTVREEITRSIPVYDTWYEYDIDKWIPSQPLVAAGNDHNWYMPDTTDYVWYTTGEVHIGDIKLGSGHMLFYVQFRAFDTKEYKKEYNEITWKIFQMNKQYELTIGFTGNVLEVKEKRIW